MRLSSLSIDKVVFFVKKVSKYQIGKPDLYLILITYLLRSYIF